MKRIEFNKYGDPEVLQLAEVPPGKLKVGEIKLNLKSSSVNPLDIKIRKGRLKFITGKKFPKTLGIDFAGVVMESKS